MPSQFASQFTAKVSEALLAHIMTSGRTLNSNMQTSGSAVKKSLHQQSSMSLPADWLSRYRLRETSQYNETRYGTKTTTRETSSPLFKPFPM